MPRVTLEFSEEEAYGLRLAQRGGTFLNCLSEMARWLDTMEKGDDLPDFTRVRKEFYSICSDYGVDPYSEEP